MKLKSFLFLLFTLSLCSCSSNNYQSDEYYLFDTFVEVRLYDGEKEDLNEIKNQLKTIDHLLDPYKTYDGLVNLAYLNENREATCPDLLVDFIKEAKEIDEITDGYINPLIGNLSKHWKDSLNENKVLDDKTISDDLKEISESSITINGNTISILGDANIDSGALAKGFALKEIKKYLDKNNIKQYLISLGSSSVLLGEKPNDEYFKVSLRELDGYYLKLKNTALSVSSIYQQYYDIDGNIYSHIINTKTGKAQVKNNLVVTTGQDPLKLDAYSTYYCLLDKDSIIKDSTVEYLLSDGNSVIYNSDDFSYYQ